MSINKAGLAGNQSAVGAQSPKYGYSGFQLEVLEYCERQPAVRCRASQPVLRPGNLAKHCMGGQINLNLTRSPPPGKALSSFPPQIQAG